MSNDNEPLPLKRSERSKTDLELFPEYSRDFIPDNSDFMDVENARHAINCLCRLCKTQRANDLREFG